ncbi:MAG: hypothetical protein AAFY56_11145 [Pseudomonadota bacterium]
MNGEFSTSSWTFTLQSEGATFVEIAEAGFETSHQEVMVNALESIGGFNPVITDAMVLLDHGVEINVIRDHALDRCRVPLTEEDC